MITRQKGSCGLHDEIRGHEYFALIADETTDISRVEQVSLCIRHVDQFLNIHDDFIGLYATAKTDAETLTTVVKDALCRLCLPLSNLRAQCYDGASNMAGIQSGVQRRIRNEQPKAVYVHCTNHSLNLALQDASSRCCSRMIWQHSLETQQKGQEFWMRFLLT